MHIQESQLKNFILDSGLVSRGDVDVAERESLESKESFGEILVRGGKITEDDLRRMRAYVVGIPFVDLRNERLLFEVLSIIPEPIARTHNIIAFKKNDKTLEVAMLDPENLSVIDFVGNKIGLRILPRLTSAESIKNAILQYQKNLKQKFGDVIFDNVKSFKKINIEEELNEEALKNLADDISIRSIVFTLLKHAVLQKAEGIHIEPHEEELLIRYRINGSLHDAMILPGENVKKGIISRIKALAFLPLHSSFLPEEGKFKLDLDGENVYFSVSVLPAYYGEKIVLRVTPQNVSGATLESLGFHGEGLEYLHKVMKSGSGMILVTGPNNSGKTKTLYSMLDTLNTPDVNISTIENIIKSKIKRINQTQVRPDIGFTFSSGLRALLRQDSDIIMLGALPDNETACLAMNSALSHHLVLSSLPTKSGTEAIKMLSDMQVPSFLISSSLKIVINQRLVRKLSSQKEKYHLSKAELSTLGKTINLKKVLTALKAEKVIKSSDDWDKIAFWRPKKGVSPEKAYDGHIGIQEILKILSPIKEIILKSTNSSAIQKQAESEGMLTLAEDGIFKAVLGLTSIEEVLSVIS